MHEERHTKAINGRTRWRTVGLPLASVAVIISAIWLLDRGLQLPISLGGDSENVSFSDTAVGTNGERLRLGANPGLQAEIGSPAPGFALMDTNGGTVQLRDFAGQMVLINFWATWCVPCRTEMPDLENAFREYELNGFVVVGVNLQESAIAASDFAKKYDLSFPVLLDSDGSVARAYRLSGLPESWVVGRDGILVQRKIGAFTRNELQMFLTELFKGILPAGLERP